jgi:hypothetical protein
MVHEDYALKRRMNASRIIQVVAKATAITKFVLQT